MNQSPQMLKIIIGSIVGIALIVFNIQLYLLFTQQKADLTLIRHDAQEQIELNNALFKQQEQKISLLDKSLNQMKKQWAEQQKTLAAANNEKQQLNDSLKNTIEQQQEEIAGLKKNVSTMSDDFNHQQSDLKQDIKTILKEMQAAKIMEARNKTIALEASLIQLEKRINELSPTDPSAKKPRITAADYN